MCVYCAHMLTKCAQPCVFVCVCWWCMIEWVVVWACFWWCILLYAYQFLFLHSGTCISFAYKGCRKSLWRLPVLRSNHVVSIVFPLYTPLWRVGTSYSFFFTDLFHSSSSFSCRLTVWALRRTHTTAQKVLLNFISPRRIDKCSHINSCTI